MLVDTNEIRPMKVFSAQNGPHPVVAVFYLLRHGNPNHLFTAFLKSLRRHDAGMPYKAVLIQKGFEAGFTHSKARLWITPQGGGPTVITVSDEGFDLTAYWKAAQAIDVPKLVFFNSYSRVLADGWLKKMYIASETLGTGSLIGATGSWESIGDSTPFPNVAIRTNAFLIERMFFLGLPHRLATKRDCNLFEAGPASLTKTVQGAGGKVGVVDRDGRCLASKDWPRARVFRSGNQERLLIADNRTMDYQLAPLRRRIRRARLAFGDAAIVRPQTFLSRWRLALAWRFGWS